MKENLGDGISELPSKDAHDVLSSWLAGNRSIPESWNEVVKAVDPMTYVEALALEVNGRSELVNRARRTMQQLELLTNTFYELASDIEAQYEASWLNFEAVSNMHGLVSLPSELLLRIFLRVVTENEDAASRWAAALRLSHVSQHFRETALSCSQIWASIGGSGEKMTNLCLSRSKDIPLDLDMTVEFCRHADDLHFEHLLIQTLPHAYRWGSLLIHLESKDRRDSHLHDPDNEDQNSRQTALSGAEINQAFHVVNAPMLHSLSISNDIDSYTKLDTFKNWNTPYLRHLTSFRYFPFSLPGLINITTLDITLTSDQIGAELLRDLSRMSNLMNFRFKWSRYQETRRRPVLVQEYSKVDLPSVRHLQIQMEVVQSSDPAENDCLLGDLFSSLYFPGAIDLHIHLENREIENGYDEFYSGIDFNNKLDRILWDWKQFPLVENLHLQVYGVCYGFSKSVMLRGCNYLLVPLDMFPGLKNITLQSNRSLAIRQMPILSNQTNLHRKILCPTPPALQSICVKMPGTGGVLNWVQGILGGQRDRGEWEMFRRLVVEEEVMDRYDEFEDLDFIKEGPIRPPLDILKMEYSPDQILNNQHLHD